METMALEIVLLVEQISFGLTVFFEMVATNMLSFLRIL